MLASYIIDPSRTIDDVNSVVSIIIKILSKMIFQFMEKEKRHVPEDTILNKHIASITEAIYACKPEMVAELESHQQIDLLLNLELPLAYLK